MEQIERYLSLVNGATGCIDSDPRLVGRWLLGLAILLEESAQHAPRVVKAARPWANVLADEGALLAATRARVAHQLRILAGESKHVRGVDHRRDFFDRVHELMSAIVEPTNAAYWIALGTPDVGVPVAPPAPRLVTPPVVATTPIAARPVVLAALKIKPLEPNERVASRANLRAAS